LPWDALLLVTGPVVCVGDERTVPNSVYRRCHLLWLTTHDRADWAILRRDDGAFLGEVVINDFDPHNESANYRIGLAGPAHFNHGYGTEATRLVIAFAFDRIGLHRLELEVFAFNPRARRVYEKCGFQLKGTLRDALQWDGVFIDTHKMAILRADPRPGDGAGGRHAPTSPPSGVMGNRRSSDDR